MFTSGTRHNWHSKLSLSDTYQSFRSKIPRRQLVVDEDSSKVWTFYDAGPRSISCPLFCLPPVSGTADIFFQQTVALSEKGLRVVAVEYPVYWSFKELIQGFTKLLDMLKIDKVHLFGASLGGFLGQKLTEAMSNCPRIESLILCNSFSDTAIFNQTDSVVMFWATPAIFLKKMVVGTTAFNVRNSDKQIQDSVEFMTERLNSLTQQEISSRLTLNCANSYVEPQKLQDIQITLIDVFDHSAISDGVKDELYKLYPRAKRAHMKKGGNFPYLSRWEEVNMHILIHLRQFKGTAYNPFEESENDLENEGKKAKHFNDDESTFRDNDFTEI